MLLKYLLSINKTLKRVNTLLGEKALVLFEKEELATNRGKCPFEGLFKHKWEQKKSTNIFTQECFLSTFYAEITNKKKRFFVPFFLATLFYLSKWQNKKTSTKPLFSYLFWKLALSKKLGLFFAICLFFVFWVPMSKCLHSRNKRRQLFLLSVGTFNF